MQNEDDLRGLAKVMDFMRAISILFVVINIYWFCYQSFRQWGINIGVVDKILLNFQRTAGLFSNILYTKLFSVVFLALSCLGTKGVKEEQDLCIPDNRFYPVLPELVVIGFTVATGGKHGIVYLYHDSRVSFVIGCRSVDFPPVEK